MRINPDHPAARIETFKCATGAGWGVQVHDLMDCDIPYSKTEAQALALAREHYPHAIRILTTADKGHYSNR